MQGNVLKRTKWLNKPAIISSPYNNKRLGVFLNCYIFLSSMGRSWLGLDRSGVERLNHETTHSTFHEFMQEINNFYQSFSVDWFCPIVYAYTIKTPIFLRTWCTLR